MTTACSHHLSTVLGNSEIWFRAKAARTTNDMFKEWIAQWSSSKRISLVSHGCSLLIISKIATITPSNLHNGLYIYIIYLFNPQQCCNDANLLSRCKKTYKQLGDDWISRTIRKTQSTFASLIRASRNQSSEFIVQLLILAVFLRAPARFLHKGHGMLICQVQFVACSSQRVYTMDQEGKR